MNKEEQAKLRERLSEEQYLVTQCAHTERPFTGKYWNHKEKGVYLCVVCGNELFNSHSKFDSHCGWPSFSEPATSSTTQAKPDSSHGMERTEVICSKCGSHLGHVFDDGPQDQGGLRYCINSASLNFQKK